MSIIKEDIYIDCQNYVLCLTSFKPDKIKNSTPTVLLHGAIENAKIFYSESNKGLAPYLAKNGIWCFALDARGRGKSKPNISKNSSFGNLDIVTQDFPKVYNKVKTLTGSNTQIWGAHSWGGVLLLHFYARYSENYSIDKMVFFGSKRQISVKSIKKYIMVNLMWRFFGGMLNAIYGYYPSKKFKFGSDNESSNTFLECDRLVKNSKWEDVDGFNYATFFKTNPLSIPLFSITGEKDDVLGHPNDCKVLLNEANATKSVFKIIGKKTGYSSNYDHITLLTSKTAKTEHFKEILSFISA